MTGTKLPEMAADNPREHISPKPRIRIRPVPQPSPSQAQIAVSNPSETASGGYAIGYGKPPKHTQFRKGMSGNPRGRPKNSKGLNTLVRETLGGKVAMRTANGTKQISKIEAVLQKALEKALKGDTRAQHELMKLWRSAVPDDHFEPENPTGRAESLNETDLAILEAYRASLIKGDI